MSSDPVTLNFDSFKPFDLGVPAEDTATNLRQSISYGLQQDPDEYAKLLKQQQTTGMAPEVAKPFAADTQHAIEVEQLNPEQMAATHARTANWAANPDNAAVSGAEDLARLKQIEEHAQQLREGPLGPAWREVKSAAGNFNASFFGAFKGLVDAAGAVPQLAWETPKALMYGLTGLDPNWQLLQNSYTQNRRFKIQDYTDAIHSYVSQGTIDAPQEYVTDPATGGKAKNPEYRWWGRGLVNALEQVPGVLAAFGLTGKAGAVGAESAGAEFAAPALENQAVPALLGTQAAQDTYAQARSQGADQKTAIVAALASGLTNYTLMGRMPAAVSPRTIPGALGQWAARSAAIGGTMTAADNAIASGYDPNRTPLEGWQKSIATMAAFEGVGTIGHIVDAVAESKLRTRSPEKFDEVMQHIFQGDEALRIPAQDFVTYFQNAKIDPAEAAARLGVTNLEEASAAGTDLEIPKANFFSRLDPEHQKGLLPDIIDPAAGMSSRQSEAHRQELADWMAGGGAEKLSAEYAQADAETQATPEWKSVYSYLKQRYVDAGENETTAESYATLQANAIANLANRAGLKPDELLALHNPKIVAGEDAKSDVLYQSPVPEGSVEGVTGRDTTLHTPTSRIPAAYRLVEAESLIASHDAQTFERNPKYPEGVQERAYDTSKEAQARVIQQSQSYEPAYTVNSNPDAVNGPPVITPEGIVLGGNSRAMSTQRLYAGDGKAYREYLKRNAEAFGFTPDQVDAMQKPVLVRQIAAPEGTDNLRRLGSELNKSMTGALGVAERAVSAGKSITPDTLRWVADTLNAEDSTLREFLGRHGQDVVQRMVRDGVITDRELPQFVDAASGGLSEEGKNFVERALLGSVIDDPRLMESAPKSVLQKLERSLGAITSFASREDEWNILPALRAAVSELGAIQRAGTSVELRLGQTSLFGGDRNAMVDALVRKLDEKPTAVKAAFDDFARDADQNLPGQARMFGGGEAFDAFNNAFGSTLSEKEYHDGLKEIASTEPARADESGDAAGDESLPERAGGEPSPGGESGAGVVPESPAAVRPAGDADASQRRVSSYAERRNERNRELARIQGEILTGGQGKQPKRGWFRVTPDGRYEIGKTKIGDFSTFIHEPAHAYLELIRELTQREGASMPLRDDFAKICTWLGTTPEEAYKDGFTREQHEQWARANEQYVREGKAPTAGLRRAFHNFSVWLGSIYRRASALGVELSSDIRGVMDRLYAGEEAVDRAEIDSAKPLFENPEDAGWTEEQYRNYADAKGIEVDKARERVRSELNDAAVRERTQQWREEKGNVRDAVTTAIDARPEYRAIRILRKGQLDDGTPLTLNRDALVKQFGEERVKTLQRQHPLMYRAEGGVDAETAAELLGFNSGDEMVRALEAAPRRALAIEQAVRDTMTARHGDIRYDGTLDDKARLAMENEDRASNLHRELQALRSKVASLEKKAADTRAAMASIAIEPLEHYQEAAHQLIQQKAIADLQPYRYLNASRKFSREAFDALRKGDVRRAADAKNKELLNHFLFREASAERDYVDKFESYAKRVQSRGIQQRLGLADENARREGRVGDYREQFNWLMTRYRLAPPPARALERTLREWADDVFGQGNNVSIAPGILNESRLADYRSVPLSEVHDLHDAMVNIRHLALQQFKMFVQGKQVAFAEAKQAMIESARENLKSKPETVFEENRSRFEKLAAIPQYIDSRLIRMERLVEWLDGGKTGPWHDNLWNLASDAQGDEYRLQEDVTRVVTDALEDMPADMRKRLWSEKVTVEGIPEPLTRRRLLSIAFNMGNEGNLDRLRKTFLSFGWDEAAIRKIGGMLTREEWLFVQKAWESLKPLGERMKELEQRLTGLPPGMVKVTPFKVALDDGTELELAGGYYPIAMDPRFSQRAIEQDAKETAQNAMQSGYVRATTAKGYTKERTGFGGPLLLDYERVLTSHVAKVAKDLSHREFMLASQRLLLDTEVRKTLRETLGSAYEKQFMPWLRTIINDNNGSVQERADTFKDLMQGLRGNIVAASLGFNTSTSLLQISHAPRMLLYAKPASLAQAFVDLLAHPLEFSREVRELSPNEMRFRGDNLDRDIRAALQEPTYRSGYMRRVAVAARFALELMDHLLSHTLWKAAYRDGLDKYSDLPVDDAHYKAMHEADSAVRLGLGSQAPKDLPALMRSNELNKFITTLYGFHNGVYNQLRDIGHQFRRDKNLGKATVASLLSVLVPAVLGNMLTGRGPNDDENPGEWAAKKAAIFAADTVPLLRSLASFAEGGHDVQFSPIESVLQKGAKAAMEIAADKDDKDWMGVGLDSAEAAGLLAGVPGAHQAVKTLRYMKRANEGKIANPNPWNAVVGGR